jgi:SacI restriction endonuclease
MKSVSVDQDAALKILRAASATARRKGFVPSSKLSDQIKAIVTGTHLTYRYVLLTALLGKATDEGVHPLALQAGANLDGAYDARSLCHGVVVPNEAELIDNGLGGSNEPYLNKPARFPQISLTNAVRPGNDRRTLQALYATLNSLKDSKEALAGLQDAIFYAVTRINTDRVALKGAIGKLTGGRHEIAYFLAELIRESHHGETCVLATAGLFWLKALSCGEKWTIAVHPVNECGSSSNQVSDIDVRVGSKLIITAEVKDKRYIAKDVDHAVGRVKREGFHTLHFIEGPRAEFDGEDATTVVAAAMESGVEVYLLDLSSLVHDVAAFAPREVTLRDFADVIAAFAKEARVKDETLGYLQTIAKKLQS